MNRHEQATCRLIEETFTPIITIRTIHADGLRPDHRTAIQHCWELLRHVRLEIEADRIAGAGKRTEA